MSPTETAMAKILADLGVLFGEQADLQLKLTRFLAQKLPSLTDDERSDLLAPQEKFQQQARSLQQSAAKLKDLLK